MTASVYLGEIYYTFADAQELRAVCSSNNFTFADDCAYYYNFDPATADILQTLPEGAKITVIDHTGDLKFDAVLITSVRAATVVSTDPLRVNVAGTEMAAQAYDQNVVLFAGQSVLYSEIRGTGYVRSE